MNRFPESLLFLSHRSGSILIAVIWVLVFFSILCVGISRVVFARVDVFRRAEGWALSASLARSAILHVQKEREIRTVYFDTSNDLMKERIQELGNGRINYFLVDEESRVDVNTASEDVLERLPGINGDLARNILKSGVRPFLVPEELLLVEGFDQKILEQCREWITVYSSGKININTASFEVLVASGIDEVQVKAVMDFRAGADRLIGTQDDGFFSDLGEVDTKMKGFSSVSDVQRARFLSLLRDGTITVRSENFTLCAQTWILDKPAMKYSIVFNADKVKRWQER